MSRGVFEANVSAGYSRFGKEHGWVDGSGGGGSEVKVPALRFAIGRAARKYNYIEASATRKAADGSR